MAVEPVRCGWCNGEFSHDKSYWCSECKRSWVHLSCGKRHGHRCPKGHQALRFVQRNRKRKTVVVEVDAGVAEVPEQLVLGDFSNVVELRPQRSRFCGRWSRVEDRDTVGMPAPGSPLAAWLAWYRSCSCELCSSVYRELVGTRHRSVSASYAAVK